jgi:hypothetical protein
LVTGTRPDGALSRPPHGPGHLVFGDLTVLCPITGDELIERAESTVMFHLSHFRGTAGVLWREAPYPPSLSGISVTCATCWAALCNFVRCPSHALFEGDR